MDREDVTRFPLPFPRVPVLRKPCTKGGIMELRDILTGGGTGRGLRHLLPE